MGLISEILVSRMSKLDKFSQLRDNVAALQDIGFDPESVKDVKQLIDTGLDSLHAAYVSMQNITSLFAEGISILPELKTYYDIMARAEDEYMPLGPPWSPLTRSYFTCWAFYDVQFSLDKETIGTCLLDLGEHLNLHPDMRKTLELMQDSRMGIYEHRGVQRGGRQKGKVLLQELISQEEHLCHVPAGYVGHEGQCWLIRILPPINDLFNYGIAFTTPYVLIGQTKDDWIAFLKRTLLTAKTDKKTQSFHEFMKYGLDLHYWNEYLFQAYHHHQADAIFLTGLPDIEASLPHGNLRRTDGGTLEQRRKRNRNVKIKKKNKRRAGK